MLTDEQIIGFNPIDQKIFTDEQIAILQNLTNEELGQLAKAYPAAIGTAPYLILHDSGKTVQNGAKATYATLFNLRVKNAAGHFSINTVVSRYNKATPPPIIAKGPKPGADMTKDAVNSAPGIKAGSVKEAIPQDATKITAPDAASATSTPTPAPEGPVTGTETGNVNSDVVNEPAGEVKDLGTTGAPAKPYTQMNKTELLAAIALRPHLTAADGAKNKDLVDMLVKDDADAVAK